MNQSHVILYDNIKINLNIMNLVVVSWRGTKKQDRTNSDRQVFVDSVPLTSGVQSQQRHEHE